MFTRREIVMLVWYALVFSAIVAWASLRPSGEPPTASRIPQHSAAIPPDRSENLIELRHIMQPVTR
jgi:hypothetical protein